MTSPRRSKAKADLDVAQAAALFAVPVRAHMLLALRGGQRCSAGGLAAAAGVSPSTASSHLAYLLDCGLLTVERHGRKRLFRLAGPQVEEALEALRLLAGLARAADGRE
ncbi:metalloregulator ArsR/SmtB family transcription factor [Streptomyces sp. Li-HN-5-11]|uniref:ArsR/SmtB family transcription factor n=1 Tax=Streptomyces sp. Li-HN-5-11 TaxID=3075432 RepID=UPI0028AF9AD1|nr:metalloregulator ArsR/SmtB family transcription factor [Streptomyces sp. Li-HN-5-11]WNM29986.1 metalloregulator ArsR/SmtB family transcription factor [Streptomyces sp. Li-HN-5-11]